MDEHNENDSRSKESHDDPLPTNRQVEVTVDSQPHRVSRGEWTVREFKVQVGVKAARVLDQVINGEFRPLDDNATITIEGGEVFVSHVPQGGSS